MRPIDDLRIVETLDEFQSRTTCYGRSYSLKYQTYYDLLINTCIRYDRTKKSNIAKRGHIYQTSSNPDNDRFNDESPYVTPCRDPYMGVDTPSDEFNNINTTQYGPPMSLGTNFNLDFPGQTRPKYIPKETNQTEMDWSYLLASTYIQTFEPRGQSCFTEI